MSETLPPQAEALDVSPTARPRRSWLPQVGLRSLFLLVAAIGVWTSYFINLREINSLNARITTVRPLARDLVIDDPSQVAVVKLQEMWYDENRWDVYLPEGQYQVCIATREITEDGIARASNRKPIPSGRHRIAFEQQDGTTGRRLVVNLDDAKLLSVEESSDWDPGRGSVGGGQFSVSEQSPANQPVVLFRRRFMLLQSGSVSSTPTGPVNGILLWIERTNGADVKKK